MEDRSARSWREAWRHHGAHSTWMLLPYYSVNSCHACCLARDELPAMRRVRRAEAGLQSKVVDGLVLFPVKSELPAFVRKRFPHCRSYRALMFSQDS